jgi:hypothetical protein
VARRTVARHPWSGPGPAPVVIATGSKFARRGTALGWDVMPIRSPGVAPAGPVRDLGLPERAVAALTRAGVTRIGDLAVLTRRDLASISGLGPGMIAAIRLVVPEPPTSAVRSGASSSAAHEESPAAPAIPSFDSLRAPRRRTAVDLLVSGGAPAPSATRSAPARAPRPPEYADLLRLGVHLVRAAAGVPVRLAAWSVREPARCLRRLLGG